MAYINKVKEISLKFQTISSMVLIKRHSSFFKLLNFDFTPFFFLVNFYGPLQAGCRASQIPQTMT